MRFKCIECQSIEFVYNGFKNKDFDYKCNKCNGELKEEPFIDIR